MPRDPNWKTIVDRAPSESVDEFKRWLADASGWLQKLEASKDRHATVAATVLVHVAALHAARVGAHLAERLRLTVPVVSPLDALGTLARYAAWCRGEDWDDAPPEICRNLTPRSLKLFRFLWCRPVADFGEMGPVWNDEPITDGAIDKAVRRLRDELCGSEYTVIPRGRTVILSRNAK